MNKIVPYIKIKNVLINGKKKCIYMKPRGTREYVRHNKEFILLNRYLKLISKKLKKQKGGNFRDSVKSVVDFVRKSAVNSVRKSDRKSSKQKDIVVKADLVFFNPREHLDELEKLENALKSTADIDTKYAEKTIKKVQEERKMREQEKITKERIEYLRRQKEEKEKRLINALISESKEDYPKNQSRQKPRYFHGPRGVVYRQDDRILMPDGRGLVYFSNRN